MGFEFGYGSQVLIGSSTPYLRGYLCTALPRILSASFALVPLRSCLVQAGLRSFLRSLNNIQLLWSRLHANPECHDLIVPRWSFCTPYSRRSSEHGAHQASLHPLRRPLPFHHHTRLYTIVSPTTSIRTLLTSEPEPHQCKTSHIRHPVEYPVGLWRPWPLRHTALFTYSLL